MAWIVVEVEVYGGSSVFFLTEEGSIVLLIQALKRYIINYLNFP